MFNLDTWTESERMIRENPDLRAALGGSPSRHALHRFSAKLLRNGVPLATCVDRIVASLHCFFSELGTTVAVDATHVEAWAVGHETLWEGGPLRVNYSDPDASWGHRERDRKPSLRVGPRVPSTLAGLYEDEFAPCVDGRHGERAREQFRHRPAEHGHRPRSEARDADR
jgi:hypothetical protein